MRETQRKIQMTRQQNASWQIAKPAVTSEHGIVAAQSRVAATAGAEMLAQGGNAVDAAIATSFALAAAEPWMSGMGGGGYMILRMAGETEAQVVDFGMRAPAALDPADYPLTGGKAGDLFPWPAVLEDRNVNGATAVAIPGHVAGMGLAHETFATRDWAELLAPAIALAEGGLPVDWYAQLLIAGSARELAQYPASAETFLDEAGFPRAAGWTALADVRCPLDRLATSLRTVAEGGPRAFYEGPLAESMVADLVAAGGCHSLKDFADTRARLVRADRYAYRGHTVFGTPELTAGPTLRDALARLEGWTPQGARPDAEAYAAWDAALRGANAARYGNMGDASSDRGPDPSCTSHFSVVDAAGNMVAVTHTLLSIFGSRLMLPESGILMNNGIMWFDPEPGKPNSLGPGKRCLSNMCPTLLERADGARFALGASGGRKIMPAVAQLSLMLMDYGMDLDTAIHAPRIDASLADTTIVDDSLPPPLLEDLRDRLAHVTPAPRTIFPLHFACPSAVGRTGVANSGATEVMHPWADAVAAGPFSLKENGRNL
jgi:gamma-glutamyltranspeptidase / glutathione hydrolase